MDKKKIGLRIKHLRLKNNLSQKDLAAKLNVNPSIISDIECGKKTTTALILLELKRIFNVTVDWILTGELAVETDEDLEEMIEELKKNYTAKIRVLSFFYDYKVKNISEFLPPREKG